MYAVTIVDGALQWREDPPPPPRHPRARVAAGGALLATGGRIVVIGVGAGAKLELNLLALMGSRATIGGSTLRSRSRDDKAAVARAVEEHVLPLLADGSVAVAVAEQLPMDAADQAYERFAAGGKFGKIVLVNRCRAAG